MKGIILAGGKGTRLYPLTLMASKQLMPVYDKPLIFYPLSILMKQGIKDVLIISTVEHLPLYKELFEKLGNIGVNFTYQVQEEPRGLADAFIVGEEFIGNDNVCLVLGDNVFQGDFIEQNHKFEKGGLIFGYEVKDPNRFGIVEFDENGKAISIEEKPENPKSDFAIPGLYFFDNRVIEIAKNVKPSERGEIEITEVQKAYLEKGELQVKIIEKEAWFDTGTHASLLQASNYIQILEEHTGVKTGCVHEIAFENSWINKDDILSASKMFKNQYGEYLKRVAKKG